jgi:fumarylacetoacetate (FAA) hydrolase
MKRSSIDNGTRDGELVVVSSDISRMATTRDIAPNMQSSAMYKKVGSACIAERRAIEMIEQGVSKTSFMKFGDRVRIDMVDGNSQSSFRAIDQRVRSASHGNRTASALA